MKYHKGGNKAIKIRNTKIPTHPYKMVIIPWRFPIPYKSLKIPIVGIFPYENPYCRDFSLRVATLEGWAVARSHAAKKYRSHYSTRDWVNPARKP